MVFSYVTTFERISVLGQAGLKNKLLWLLVFVPDSIDRMNKFLIWSDERYFFAEFFDVAVDGPVANDPLIAVKSIHQLITGKNPSGIVGQDG